ncbi:MAG: hypothetical protein O9972_14325 [Burkholderiales bacterium]|nr:hypothetical protein [Burkholderiales bacterium]
MWTSDWSRRRGRNMTGHASPLFAFDLATVIAALEALVARDDVLSAAEKAIVAIIITRLRAIQSEAQP